MKKPLHILWILLLILASCRKDKDEMDRKTYDLNPFQSIALNNSFEVYLVEGPRYYLEAEASKSNLDNLSLVVQDQRLTVSNKKKLKWTNPKHNKIKLYIHSPPLKEVHANESCEIKSLTPITSDEFGLVLKSKANSADLVLNTRVFYYWNNFPCGGKLSLAGKTEELKIWNTAIMSVDAKYLQTDYALIENNSQGVCEVNVVTRLDYKINGSGDIHLYGGPAEINQGESSSSGKLVQY